MSLHDTGTLYRVETRPYMTLFKCFLVNTVSGNNSQVINQGL